VSAAHGPWAVDGALWQELMTVLDDALSGERRRALVRLAEREETAGDEAARELAAFPARSCEALAPGVGLAPERCTAGRGCPVADECPLVRDGGAGAIRRSALAQLVAALVERWRRPLVAAPFPSLAELPALVEQLLARSGRIGPDSAPRSRTATTVLDVAIHRGGPLGATGPFLLALELEQVAAFVPPGAGRGDGRLGPVEAWLRRAVAGEVALLDQPGGRPGRGR